MKLKLMPSLAEKIEKQYEKSMERCPGRKKEADAWLESASEEEAVCLKFLYAYMHPGDLISYGIETYVSYVKATLAMYETVSYAQQVPAELFFTYVLCARVNNEDLDGSRSWLFEQLGPRVKDKKTMTEAALEVNYWCYEKATYIPSDGRTLAPFGMCRSARGRCGEESTLAVCAMRSVGIPARQCYVPRWAHCDDNHAWVEVWTDGAWHYLGACEPEPVLDKGWFSAAASKAMLVHAKACSDLETSREAAYTTPLYSLMNVTETYADCVRLHVAVTDGGIPAEGVPVSFCLINYSELFELYSEKTDRDGRASFLTGKGDLYVSAVYRGRFLGMRVDVREQQEVILEMEKGIDPERTEGIREERFDLNPPLETMPKAASAAQKQEHEKRLAECEAIRGAYESGFVKEEGGEGGRRSRYYVNARGNWKEIRRFFEAETGSEEDKCQLLDTLRRKDFIDTDADVLVSYLKAALPWKGSVPEAIYRDYILAPRVANEKLTDYRGMAADIWKQKEERPGNGVQVWEYLKKNLTILPDYGMKGWTADPACCLKYGLCTEDSLPVVFVQVCRALGIPARLNPVTRKPEAVLVDGEQVRYQEMAEHVQSESISDAEQVKLTLTAPSAEPVEYGLHFSIARYENGRYHTLDYFGTAVNGSLELALAPGSYRIITTLRQIDGGVSAVMKSFRLDKDQTVALCFGKDETAEKLLYAELPDTQVQPVAADGTKKGDPVSLCSLYKGEKAILIFADPGKEPTEHLFQEILECREAYQKEGYRLVISLADPAGLKNETLGRVISSGLEPAVVLCTDDAYLYRLHEAFHVGDERLPFAAALDRTGKGLFAFANYNIRTAWTLMGIFRAAGE